MDQAIFGLRLKSWRERAAKSVSACAEFVRITDFEYENFELGSKLPTRTEFAMIAYFVSAPAEEEHALRLFLLSQKK